MIATLDCRRIPSRNAAAVPGSLTSRSWARSSIASAAQRDSASTPATSAVMDSSQASGIRAGPSSGLPGAGGGG